MPCPPRRIPFIALLFAVACGGGDSGTTAPPVKPPNTIDAAGGTVATTSGSVSLAIPAGALRVAPSGRDRRLLPLLLDPRSASSVFRYAAYARLLVPGEASFIARAA